MNSFTLLTYDKSKRAIGKLTVPYSVINGAEYVTEHFSRAELDTGHDENAMFFRPTLQIIEKVREIVGPITADSGYRSRDKQKIVYDEYITECKKKDIQPVPGKVAKPGHSPHETGAAVDLTIPAGYDPEQFTKLLQKVSISLGFPAARVGWKDYLGQNFVHMDEVFLLFKPYTEAPNPFSAAWIPGVTW